MAASSWNSVDPSSMFPLSMYAMDCKTEAVHKYTSAGIHVLFTHSCRSIAYNQCSRTLLFFRYSFTVDKQKEWLHTDFGEKLVLEFVDVLISKFNYLNVYKLKL